MKVRIFGTEHPSVGVSLNNIGRAQVGSIRAVYSKPGPLPLKALLLIMCNVSRRRL